MQLSITKVVSAFCFFSVALADLHASCTCHNGDSYNWRMTTKSCTIYNDAGYEWGGTTYDSASGRCTQNSSEENIAGDQWEDACKEIAKSGFDCADGVGTCYASPDDIKGWCK
ncbi:hypothetical protein EDB81DRAFT_808299 [Dactylonectria macrodidyma]|uniref:Uncharacterized protein n=1 Tax=Dactylonectria macrodidyma TaxID=307937 RepID=A0A9P9E578_9HYPO|nr:hypothetical protein EDB81DRAFT_808299 [Dactylonectria macrodidyma]